MLSLDSNELFNVPIEFEKRELCSGSGEISIQVNVNEIPSYRILTKH